MYQQKDPRVNLTVQASAILENNFVITTSQNGKIACCKKTTKTTTIVTAENFRLCPEEREAIQAAKNRGAQRSSSSQSTISVNTTSSSGSLSILRKEMPKYADLPPLDASTNPMFVRRQTESKRDPSERPKSAPDGKQPEVRNWVGGALSPPDPTNVTKKDTGAGAGAGAGSSYTSSTDVVVSSPLFTATANVRRAVHPPRLPALPPATMARARAQSFPPDSPETPGTTHTDRQKAKGNGSTPPSPVVNVSMNGGVLGGDTSLQTELLGDDSYVESAAPDDTPLTPVTRAIAGVVGMTTPRASGTPGLPGTTLAQTDDEVTEVEQGEIGPSNTPPRKSSQYRKAAPSPQTPADASVFHRRPRPAGRRVRRFPPLTTGNASSDDSGDDLTFHPLDHS